ncbi:MAG: peptidyl-prolyl cis-trans isomerase [Alphaproteobacteria bacterium]|nr:peptidyl-prolyl cis-trans isomerase [Alphaproteobacteria bacterium]
MIIWFRKASENFFFKILLFILALSMISAFAVGNIFDAFKRKSAAISVAGQSVSMDNLLRAFQDNVNQLQKRMGGRYISTQDAIAQGWVDITVAQLVDQILKEEMMDDLGVAASDAAVRNYLTANPNFKTLAGQFDRRLFEAYLQQMNLSEKAFLDKLRQELAYHHVADALRAVTAVPAALQKALYAHDNEKRSLLLAMIDSTQVPVAQQASKKELEDYYELMQDELFSPEYRTLSTVEVSPETLASVVSVTEAEVKEAYNARKDTLSTPEKRRVLQVIVEDESAAKAFAKKATSANFIQQAKDLRGADAADLGYVAATELLDELSAPLFDAKVGKVIGPVQTELGWHVLVATDKQNARTVTWEQARADIAKELKAARAYETLYQVSQQIDEILAEGQDLATAAKAVSLRVKQWPSATIEGKSAKGQTGLPDEVLSVAFTLQEGETSTPISYKDGFVFVRVDSVEPAQALTFAQAKPRLQQAFKQDKQKEQLATYAQQVLKEAKASKSLAKAGKVKNFTSVQRQELEQLPADMVNQIFDAPVQSPFLVPVGDQWALIMVTKKEAASKDATQEALFKNQLNAQISQSAEQAVLGSYAGDLTVNKDEIEKTFRRFVTDAE